MNLPRYELPLNLVGGYPSAGRTNGYGHIQEAVIQLQGDGGRHQVPRAEVALVSDRG